MIYLGIYLIGIILSIAFNFVYFFLYTEFNKNNCGGEATVIPIRCFLSFLSWFMVIVEIYYIITLLIKKLLNLKTRF